MVLWFVFYKYIFRFSNWIIKFQIAVLKKDGKLPISKSNRLQFEDEFIHEFTDFAETKIRYASIERIEEGAYAIYAYFSAVQAIIIPFSVFDSAVAKEEFVSWLRGQV